MFPSCQGFLLRVDAIPTAAAALQVCHYAAGLETQKAFFCNPLIPGDKTLRDSHGLSGKRLFLFAAAAVAPHRLLSLKFLQQLLCRISSIQILSAIRNPVLNNAEH